MVEKYADHAKQVTSEAKEDSTAIFAQVAAPVVMVSDYAYPAMVELTWLTDSARAAVSLALDVTAPSVVHVSSGTV